ncbi:MAG: hypothetical protein ABIY52_02645 [Gemmatimonadaceae bacterium]
MNAAKPWLLHAADDMLCWIVEAVVCFVEKLCQFLILAAAVALAAAILGLVAASAAIPVPLALPSMIGGATIAFAALLVAKILCELGMCRFLGVLVWALKWSIVLGAVLSLLLASAGSIFVVVVCGGIVSMLIRSMTARSCAIPHLLGLP